MTTAQFLLLTHDERRRVSLKKRRRGRYEKRRNFSKEELLEYLRKNAIRSTRQLKKCRQPVEHPDVWDYVKRFGSWSAAQGAAFGPLPPAEEVPRDPHYILKTVVEFGLWTQERYLEARRRRPDVVASANQVRRLFGSFGNLFVMAQRESVKETLNQYLALGRRLGRRPSAMDCRKEGLDISVAVKHFGAKPQMDRLIDEIQVSGRKGA